MLLVKTSTTVKNKLTKLIRKMVDVIKSLFDIFFYGLTILAILYWLFSTSREEKFRDIRNQVKKINDMIDDIETLTKQKEENSSNENKEKTTKKDKNEANTK